MEDLPKVLQEWAAKEDAGGPVEGAYYQGTVYLVADELPGRQRTREVLAHEAVVHFSLEELMGEDYGQLLKDIQTLKAAGGLDRVVSEVHQRYGRGLDSDTEAAEIAGVMAEGRGNEPEVLSILRRIRAAIRRFLRALGFNDVFNAKTLDDLITAAGQQLRGARARRRRATAPPGEPMFSRRRPGVDLGRLDGKLPDGTVGGVAYRSGKRWKVTLHKKASGELFEGPKREQFVGSRAEARQVLEEAGLNTGLHETTIEDISQKPLFPDGFDLPEQGPAAWVADGLLFAIQDQFRPLATIQKSAERHAGKTLPDDINAKEFETLFHGRTEAQVADFRRDHWEPLARAMAKSGVTVEQLETYLRARHAKEANARLQEINPNEPDNAALSGMSNEDATEVLSHETPSLRALAKGVDAIIEGTRDLLVEGGLETEETVRGWRDQYEHYVPLPREGMESQPSAPGSGKGFSIRGREFRHRLGSRRNVVGVLARVKVQRELAIIRAEKNRVGQSLLRLAEQFPHKDIWSVDKVGV